MQSLLTPIDYERWKSWKRKGWGNVREGCKWVIKPLCMGTYPLQLMLKFYKDLLYGFVVKATMYWDTLFGHVSAELLCSVRI